LQQNGLKVQGIFRLSGSSERVNFLREAIDKSGGDTVEFKSKSDEEVHCVSGLLKAFLRELPEPLTTFDIYAPLLENPWDFETVRRLMSTIPALNRKVLKFLFSFINQVKENSNVNQMHEGNLAIVFGPNLLRPRDSRGSELTDTPKILAAVQTMINYYTYLFEENVGDSSNIEKKKKRQLKNKECLGNQSQ